MESRKPRFLKQALELITRVKRNPTWISPFGERRGERFHPPWPSVDDERVPAGPKHPPHFTQRAQRVRVMVERERAIHGVEPRNARAFWRRRVGDLLGERRLEEQELGHFGG